MTWRLPAFTGPCYLLVGKDWARSASDLWEVEIYATTTYEFYVGRRVIEGVACVVYGCPDARYRAWPDKKEES